MINKTVTTKHSSAKPRVMLFVDDSGSMAEHVNPIRMEKCGDYETQIMDGGVITWIDECSYNEYGYLPSSRYEPAGYRVTKSDGMRLDIVKNALKQVVDEQGDKLHWNLISLWGTEKFQDRYKVKYGRLRGKYVKMLIPNLVSNNHTPVSENGYLSAGEIKKYIDRLQPAYSTPTTQRYLQSINYVVKEIKHRCQSNAIVMLSDGDANTGKSGYMDLNSGLRSYFTKPYYPYNPYAGGVTNGIAYFSKQLILRDLKRTGTDIEGLPWDGSQLVETYSIGFGNGLSKRGFNYLYNAGATIERPNGVTPKSYYTADDPASLVKAFKEIFASVTNPPSGNPGSEQTTSISTPASTSSSLDNLAATLTLDTGIWSSEIQFNKLDSNGKPEKSSITNKNIAYPANYMGRKVLVNNGKNIYWLMLHDTPSVAYKDFGFSSKTKEMTTGFIQWYLRNPNISDERIENNVAALGLNESKRTVEKYRKRTDTATDPARQMGDVLGAPVVAMGENSEYVATGANDGMVYIFKSSSNPNVPYELKMNYVPAGMEREGSADTLGLNIKRIAESNYGSSANKHIYGINGGIAYTTTAETGNRRQRTLIVGAMGQGGRGFYALNIAGCERNLKSESCVPVGLDAAESDWDKSVPLWESKKGSKNLLGYTIGTPSLYQLALDWKVTTTNKIPDLKSNVVLAAFAGNGYQTKDTSVKYDPYPALYVYNALGEDMGIAASTLQNGTAGELIKTIPAKDADGIGALASPVVVDINFDGVADIAYAGDYHGDLYRFDLRGEPHDWYSVKIYDGDPSQPITAAPAVYRNGENNLIVSFGTGSDIYENDPNKTVKQGFFGIYDDLSDAKPFPAQKNNLLRQSLTKSDNIRVVTNNEFDPKQQRGWWVELDGGYTSVLNNTTGMEDSTSNEKVVVQPQILLSTVFFTTRIYRKSEKSLKKNPALPNDGESCRVDTASEESTGTSWLLGVNVKNGGVAETVKFRNIGDPRAFVGSAKTGGSAGYDIGVLASQPNIIGGDTNVDAINSNAQVVNGTQLDLSGASKRKTPPNDCLTKDDYQIQISQASLDRPLGSVELTGPLCQVERGLIRLNIVEIQ